MPRSTKQEPKKQWTGAEKLRVVGESCGLSETELGALLRREGRQERMLAAWRSEAEAALAEPVHRPASLSLEGRRIKELERELAEKVLAETAALLVLKQESRRSGGTGTIPRAGGSAK